MAVAAAGTVLAAGVGVTSLAAWTDNEWVEGGFNGTGLTASSFEVEQNVTTATDGSGWTNDLGAGSPGEINFSALAQNLTPNDIVYGIARLRTQPNSAAGTVSLIADTTATTGLAAYLTYRAVVLNPTDAAAYSCTSASFTSPATVLANPLTALTSGGTGATFTVPAATSTAGAEKVICFQITMSGSAPDGVQGQSVTPLWHFFSQSN